MIDVTTASVAGADGQLGVALGVDLSKAQVPDRRYAADVCSVARVRGTVKVMFGQERVDGSGWRTLLVIEMSEVAISQFLQSVDSMKNPTLEQIAAGSNFQPEELTEASEPTQPNQAVSLVANLVLTAFAGNEACIDFYHMSPFAVGWWPTRTSWQWSRLSESTFVHRCYSAYLPVFAIWKYLDPNRQFGAKHNERV